MFYRTFFAFGCSVFFKLITVPVRCFLVPTTRSFKRFSLWTSVAISDFIVLELRYQIIRGCTVFITFSLLGLRYNCSDIGLLADFYLFAIMVTFIYQCSISSDG